jgi:two-component system sensor histidine kinase KdpD
LLVLAAMTAFLVQFRGRLDKAHITLVYLLVVLAGTLTGGRALGWTLAALAFLLFNWFLLPPYGTFALNNSLDWLVLVAFLVVSSVVAEILHRLRGAAEAARSRAAEIDRFALLGAEALKVGRAESALSAISEAIRGELALHTCRIHVVPDSGGAGSDLDPLVSWSAGHGRTALRLADGATRLTESADLPSRLEDALGVCLPLTVRGRTLGVLELETPGVLELTPAQRRFLAALTHYAALALERVRLEAAADRVELLREADRMKDALLASVSHDLRTPLTTIKALAHALAASDERALIIEEEADRLTRLVANLLDLTRLRTGTLALNLEINAVDDLIGALVQRVSGVLPGRELRVDLEAGGTLLVGRFDLAHALRILVNLVENAGKYAPPGTPIDLGVRREGERLSLTVSDRGPGVSAAEAERIFEPLYQASGRTPDSGGAGLGLAIARQLARAQGGEVTYSDRPAGGACFTLTLPAADLPEQLPL